MKIKVGDIVRFKRFTTIHVPNDHTHCSGCIAVDEKDFVVIISDPFCPNLRTRPVESYNEIFVLTNKGVFLVDAKDFHLERLL